MDPRKQKRLGAAPIASFEKSLEDATSAHMGVTSSAATATTLAHSSMYPENYQKTVRHNNNRNDKEKNTKMDYTIATTTRAIATETIEEHITTENKEQKEDELSASISTEATAAAAAAATVTMNRTIEESDFKRPPTLKAANENNLQTYRGFTTLTTPQTPRIEFSRASSGSTKEEDSRESSPENVFDQVGTGTLQETIGLGFREEGALELRSSTEELYFMDKVQKKEEQEKIQVQQQQPQQQQQQQQQHGKRSSPHFFKIEEHQIYLQQHQRKDSASSEVAALLCISGRTSRISSVGSQGSAVSHLSAISGVSRSPSPHRMLLETSFCGPKPMDNAVDCRVHSSVEPQTVQLLEQMLLRRRQDPTQAVLAEGIKIEGSPKKKVNTLSNGESKSMKPQEHKSHKINDGKLNQTKSTTMGAQRPGSKSPGQMVVGKTPSGKEYIRINLKPDHMYADKGIASNERVVDAPNTLAPVYATSQKKPGTLSLGGKVLDGNLLTPTASPKAARHAKEARSSRSPSPANVSVSRKSSFSSLFRFGGAGKDSPDSPKESRSRSRSKSKDLQVSQSQNVTPNKQKSVLAIFKPSGKRSSSSGIENKTSSPNEPQLELAHQQQRSASQTPVVPGSASNSRPGSRLRYYDPPVEGVIHIPLHTPPEEKETRKVLQGIQQLNAEPVRPIPTPITASQLAAAAKALKPVAARKDSGNGTISQVSLKSIEKTKRLQNVDAIQTLSQDEDSKPLNWSLEVRHSSQDSQDTVASESSYAHAIRVGLRPASHLPDVKEQEPQHDNSRSEADPNIHRLSSVESNTSASEPKIIETVATINTNTFELPLATQLQSQKDDKISAKEKRRLLFATRIGSGSQEQIFSTQFSVSKTESLSSQLSERGQETIMESPETESLQRQGTVIRREEEDIDFMTTAPTMHGSKRQAPSEVTNIRQKSCSTSEDERATITKAITTAVVLRRKVSSDEYQHKSRSTSEEDADNINPRHSRYLENLDIRKRFHDTIPRKPKRQSISETKVEEEEIDPFEVPLHARQDRKPQIPQPPPPSSIPTPSPAASTAASARGSRTPTPTIAVRSQSQSPVEHSRQTPTKPPRNITPTSRRSQVTTPTSPLTVVTRQPGSNITKRASTVTDRQSAAASTDEPVESSESERDSGSAAPGSSSQEHKRRHIPHCHAAAIEDHESTGLVSQESFDDELPYIPTTLPEERAHGIAIIPMKERANMELKMCPVERPRSTTPLNPSHLEEFGMHTPQESPHELYASIPVRGEKLRISLPRKDPNKEKVQCVRSPRRTSNASGKSWFEFAEEGLRATTAGNLERKDSSKQLVDNIKKEIKKPSSAPTPPVSKTVALTQKALSTGKSTQRKLSGHWIDFENIPEKRKPPKRITALPKKETTSRSKSPKAKHSHAQPDLTSATSHVDGKLHYDYVKPEDCQCECHEVSRCTETTTTSGLTSSGEVAAASHVSSVDLLQQGDDMLPLLDTDGHEGIEISHLSDSSREYSYYTDDEGDVPERRRTSGRRLRSPAKGEFPRREFTHSPRNRKFPDNRK